MMRMRRRVDSPSPDGFVAADSLDKECEPVALRTSTKRFSLHTMKALVMSFSTASPKRKPPADGRYAIVNTAEAFEEQLSTQDNSSVDCPLSLSLSVHSLSVSSESGPRNSLFELVPEYCDMDCR
jgi:hypothetical protein